MTSMQFTRLGSTGATVSRLCLGMMTYGSKKSREWALEEAESRPLIKKAVDLGFNFFDTADVYSHGRQRGDHRPRAQGSRHRRAMRSSSPPRCTARWDAGPNMRGLSRKHIMQAIDASLRRLGMDYVDLYQIHRFDPATPMEETLEALTDVVKAGKALYIGASSMFAWQFAQYLALAERHGLSRFVTMQNHYNLLYREEEREMLPLCRAEGHRRHPVEPARARAYSQRPRAESDATPSRQDRRLRQEPLPARRGRWCRDRSRHRNREKARRAECSGRARLATGPARRHRADHRRQQDVTSRRRGERPRPQA